MARNLLILGASSDLAVELIPRVAGQFTSVFAHYHRHAPALAQLQGKLPCSLNLLQADFSSEEETKRFVDEVAASGADITHILHCPSAAFQYRRLRQTSWEEYERMLNIQLRSFHCVCARFLPAMAKRQYGKVVAVLSSCTVAPQGFISAYMTAKYALLGFVKSAAAEYADKSVQINAVSPSMMETKFLEQISPHTVEKAAQEHPLGRNATVRDVVPAIEFLLSDQSGFITGQNLLISGGSVL